MSTPKYPRRLLNRRLSLVLASLLTLCSLNWAADAQDEPKKGPIPLKMREKLDAAARVLEGLAIEDKEMIQKGTKILMAVSKAEVWQVLKDAEYREHTQAFRSAIKRLDEAVQESKFAAAQLEWLDATRKCFDCHNHVRAQKAGNDQK